MDGLIALALAKKGSTASLNGSGAPSSSLTAKKGDLYLDSTNNKVYVCTNYVSPNVSDLTGLTITFNDVLKAEDFTTYKGTYSVSYTDGSYSENAIIFSTDQDGTLNVNGQVNGAAYITWRISQGWSPWTMSNMKHLTFSGGADVANPNLVNFVLRNATIEGTGSTWMALDAELPQVSSTDNGKFLGVSSGAWTKVDAPSGVALFEGATAPLSSINAKIGDLYKNTSNGDIYVCTNYIDPNNITTLTGLTVVFSDTPGNNQPIPLGVNLVALITSGTTKYWYINFTCDSTSYTQIRVDKDWYYMYYGSTQVAKYGGVPVQWNDQKYRTVTFGTGTDATDTDFIQAVISSADSISGIGSTWTLLEATPSYYTLTITGDLDDGFTTTSTPQDISDALNEGKKIWVSVPALTFGGEIGIGYVGSSPNEYPIPNFPMVVVESQLIQVMASASDKDTAYQLSVYLISTN